MDCDRAQIPLRLMVVEGDGEVVEKGEHRVLVAPQPIEQVAHGTLYAAPAPLEAPRVSSAPERRDPRWRQLSVRMYRRRLSPLRIGGQ